MPLNIIQPANHKLGELDADGEAEALVSWFPSSVSPNELAIKLVASGIDCGTLATNPEPGLLELAEHLERIAYLVRGLAYDVAPNYRPRTERIVTPSEARQSYSLLDTE